MKTAHNASSVARGRRTASHEAPSSIINRKVSKNAIANLLCVVGLLVLVSSLTSQIM